MWTLLVTTALATSLSLRSEATLEPGVTLRTYRASSPSTDVYVLVVDLCADGVYLDATRASDSAATVGAWGGAVDATAATNGDFYKTGPLLVYGDAVGGGVRWPTTRTGAGTQYAAEWYYEHYGWIAFLHDGVEFSHTGYVKDHSTALAAGWRNDTPRPTPPPGTIALVSGFPELVIEGAPVTCADPTAATCFPDRSDMRARHPRTAIGITEDRGTLFLVVADGRTSTNAGLYGSELADVLGELGAWEAFNLDGGGSSELWTDSGGYENDTAGNNLGNATRAVANHWGVFAGGRTWLPERPGHCAAAPSCGTVPPPGRDVDDADPCFRTFGPQTYWRTANTGQGGHLHWTNAWQSSLPDNWAWWRLEFEEEGDYEVFAASNATWSVDTDVRYGVMADGVATNVRVDPTSAPWVSLGTFHFAAGGEQWVSVNDDQSTAPAADQHIVADAVRVVRVGPWCGDGACDATEACTCEDCPIGDELPANGVDDDCDGTIDEVVDTGTTETGDSAAPDTTPDSDPDSAPDSVPDSALDTGPMRTKPKCGCASTDATGLEVLALLALASARRRR